MARKKQQPIVEIPEWFTWAERRTAMGLPESKRIRERGKCYDCGEPLAPTGWHSRLEEWKGKAFAADFCCACAGYACIGHIPHG